MKIFSGKGLDSRLVYDRVVRITDSLSDTLSCCEYVEVSLFSIVGGLGEAALDIIVSDSVYVIYYPTINLLPLRAKICGGLSGFCSMVSIYLETRVRETHRYQNHHDGLYEGIPKYACML